MMNDLDMRLGSRLSLLEVKSIAAVADSAEGAEVLSTLLDYALGEDDTRAVQASWVLTHVSRKTLPQLVHHTDALIRRIVIEKHPSRRRLLLTLVYELLKLQFPRLLTLHLTDQSVDEGELLTPLQIELLNFCFEHIAPSENAEWSQSLCIKIGEVLTRPIPELRRELRDMLTYFEEETLTPAMAATTRNTLKLLR